MSGIGIALSSSARTHRPLIFRSIASRELSRCIGVHAVLWIVRNVTPRRIRICHTRPRGTLLTTRVANAERIIVVINGSYARWLKTWRVWIVTSARPIITHRPQALRRTPRRVVTHPSPLREATVWFNRKIWGFVARLRWIESTRLCFTCPTRSALWYALVSRLYTSKWCPSGVACSDAIITHVGSTSRFTVSAPHPSFRQLAKLSVNVLHLVTRLSSCRTRRRRTA